MLAGYMASRINLLEQELKLTLDELESLGVRWIEARAGGFTYKCGELDAESKVVERKSRKLERKIRQLRKKEQA